MKELVAKEFEITQEQVDKMPTMYKVGEKYTVFMDPETDKVYRPVAGFTVTGEDLSDKFVEVAQ
jgi:hypothetical protein